jgi:hypothetical protein
MREGHVRWPSEFSLAADSSLGCLVSHTACDFTRASRICSESLGRQIMKARVIWVSGSILFTIACFALPASAKQSDAVGGKVVGTIFVTNSEGTKSFVADATVKLTGPITRDTRTDENGRYSLEAVPFGTYSVEALSPGLRAIASINVETGRVQADLELKPLPVTDSALVTADRDRIHQSRSFGNHRGKDSPRRSKCERAL